MESGNSAARLRPLENRVAMAGLLLAGVVIAVTAVSYVWHSPFRIRWLVWTVGVAFAAVALLAMEWPRAWRHPGRDIPRGRLRQFLLLALPLSFVLDSQICGLGLKACTFACHAISWSLIVLSSVTAVRIHQGKPIAPLLVVLLALGLAPHCVCHAPINVIWHNALGAAPTCQVMPLAATLFSISALRGVRPKTSTALAGLMLVVIAFIAVSNPLFGFPWRGCVG